MKIKFIPSCEDTQILIPPPEPSSMNLPDWYLRSETFDYSNIKFDDDDRPARVLKQCMPFLDSIRCGYVQKTWCDLIVTRDDENVYVRQAPGPLMFSGRNRKNLPTGSNYLDQEFVWVSPWMPKLPSGYSCLYVHPLNRFDLPFSTVSGIIDSDVFYHSPNGNMPFYIEKNFTGIIPMGTPMYQMIPFKRDEWSSKIEEYDNILIRKNHFAIVQNFFGSYKNNFWQKKRYK